MNNEELLQRVKELERTNQEYKVRLKAYQRNKQIAKKIEDNYQKLLDNSLVGIFQTDISGNLLYVNDTLVKMIGYNTPEELLKDNVLKRYKNYSDRSLLLESLKNKGKVVDFEVEFVCRSGTILTTILNAVLEKNQIFGVLVDITQRKHIENDLVESEAYNKILFWESCTPIVILNPETGKFVDCNPAAVKIYDFKNYEDVIGKTPLDVSAPVQYDGMDSSTAASKHIEKALNQGSQRFEWYHQRPNGTTWDAEVFLMLFQHKKKFLLQFTLQDVTDRKKAEKAREKSFKSLQEALDNVKTLSGLVPICSNCKKIRDDKGFWNQIEAHIQKHTSAKFSHGICPECSDKFYGNENWYIKRRKKKKGV